MNRHYVEESELNATDERLKPSGPITLLIICKSDTGPTAFVAPRNESARATLKWPEGNMRRWVMLWATKPALY